MSEALHGAALEYHAKPRPGKLEIALTKPCGTQRELGLAYSPGVAAPVREITANPEAAYLYTAKANLVAVITDGTAVLGLGNVGALAGKPVMEGKGVLFKKFADIDVFDIEVNAKSPAHFVDVVTAIAPTFGAINLEDVAAPHCFEIETALMNRLDIPVFHDDQHGTAIIVAAGLMNALELQGKKLPDVRIVCLGAGAAGIASMRLLVALGADRENMLLVDRQGVLHGESSDLNPYKSEFICECPERTLRDSMAGSDVFIGVAAANLVDEVMLRAMAPRPVVFALSNPDPEIHPVRAHAARNDLIIATGRTDFPNQVNNVLGFPYIFRGALDIRARQITRTMHIAAVQALRNLAQEPVPAEVLAAYHLDHLEFGPDYIIPKPFDPRLRECIPPTVARAAIVAGVARLPYPAHYPSQTF
ncbi:NADP-dependent malic enzyme [Gammaproteobacteria bacterium]